MDACLVSGIVWGAVGYLVLLLEAGFSEDRNGMHQLSTGGRSEPQQCPFDLTLVAHFPRLLFMWRLPCNYGLGLEETSIRCRLETGAQDSDSCCWQAARHSTERDRWWEGKQNPALWVSRYTQWNQVPGRPRAQLLLTVTAWVEHCRAELLPCSGTPACLTQSATSQAHAGTAHEPSTQPVQASLFLLFVLTQEGSPRQTS